MTWWQSIHIVVHGMFCSVWNRSERSDEGKLFDMDVLSDGAEWHRCRRCGRGWGNKHE